VSEESGVCQRSVSVFYEFKICQRSLFAFEVCDKSFVRGVLNTLLINLIEHINNKISISMSRNRIATKYGGLNQLKKAPVYLIAVLTSAAQI
jgi:hypothetical protein